MSLLFKRDYSLFNVGGNERAGALRNMFLPASPASLRVHNS